MRDRAQVGPQARDSGSGQPAGETGRQLAIASGLHHGNHVRRPAAEEKAQHQLRRERNSNAAEFLRSDCGGNRLAVDQHPVAVKDDHESPRPRTAAAVHFLYAISPTRIASTG